MAAPARQAPAPGPLEVRVDAADGRVIHPTDGIDLRLSRPLVEGEERLAVMLADVDWTSLFTQTGQTLSYHNGPVRFPSGDSKLSVYLVTGRNDWRELTTGTLRVTTASRFEQAELLPKIALTNTGQVAETHAPASNAPARHLFQDFAFNLGFQSRHLRAGVTTTTQTNVLAVTNQTQALRFGLRGQEAPKIDLADYLWAVDGPKGKVSVGTITFNPEKHLVSNLASRGVSGTVRGRRADATFAALNGNAIVGFDNFFGVSTRANQIEFASVGVELDTSRPGGARVEGTFVDGSRLTAPGFTQGQINDVEKSRGLGVRFIGADRAARLHIDSGFARSQFSNPQDQLLSRGRALVPIQARTDDALYLDSSYDVVKNAHSGSRAPVTVTGEYHFERVDPLYRSVGVPQAVRSDLLQNVVGVSSTIGQVAARVTQTWAHDNLGAVASLLRTTTTTTTANLALPTGAFATRPHSGLPVLSYSLNRTTQIGVGPQGTGPLMQLQNPDQANILHSLRSDWSDQHWRAAYSLNYSSRDNRQPGRETSDFADVVHLVSVGVSPGRTLDLGTDVTFEAATNKELARINHTRRIAITGNWRIRPQDTVNGTLNRTLLRDVTTGTTAVTEVSAQYSHVITMRRHGVAAPQFQLFGRMTWQSTNVLELLYGNNQQRRNWAITTGATVSVF